LRRQKELFDEMAPFFASPEAIPTPQLVAVHQHLADRVIGLIGKGTTNRRRRIRILDAGCGTGAMFPYLLRAAKAAAAGSSSSSSYDGGGVRLALDVVGVDLSPKMTELARTYARQVLEEYYNDGNDDEGDGDGNDSRHTIQVVASDLMEYYTEDGSPLFDAVVANACFGNFLNQVDVLKHCADDLLRRDGGYLFATHPLGRSFVNDKLHVEDPETVPNLLPSRRQWQHLLVGVNLQLRNYEEEYAPVVAEDDDGGSDGAPTTQKKKPYYLAALRRVRYRVMPRLIRLRGSVDEGYGRGGKKLGFPTANLPSRLFQNALSTVETGVYVGWAVVEGTGAATADSDDGDDGRNVPHKAVVNVGYSPTFEGQENPEKIVEAHLILEPDEQERLSDFYGEPVRLELAAYLRPEQKFDSFPDLVKQITADRDDAAEALDAPPFDALRRRDPFLLLPPPPGRDRKNPVGAAAWVGQSGGDEESSWEFCDAKSVLDDVYSDDD